MLSLRSASARFLFGGGLKAGAIKADGGGPPSFEVLSSKSQTEEGGCVLRGEAGAGAAFNIAAAGGTGVWSFKIIRTYKQKGLFAYVGVASESFSAAHGGAAYFFDLRDGSICSTKNAHELGFDKLVLQTSDALEGKTDGALIDMRVHVREDGGKRYVAFRVNGGGWNEVVADGLPAVVRPYARCDNVEDRISDREGTGDPGGSHTWNTRPKSCRNAAAARTQARGRLADWRTGQIHRHIPSRPQQARERPARVSAHEQCNSLDCVQWS